MTKSLLTALLSHAVERGEHSAIERDDVVLTYSELWVRLEYASEKFSAYGVSPFDRVVVIADKTIETTIALLSLLHLGAIAVPVHPSWKPSQLNHVIDDCEATLLIANRANLAQLSAIPDSTTLKTILLHNDCSPEKTVRGTLNSQVRLHRWSTLVRNIPSRKPDRSELRRHIATAEGQTDSNLHAEHNKRNEVAILIYTSGSTGTPKGVKFTHDNITYGAMSVGNYLNYTDNDRILALMPFSFDYGLNQLTSSLYFGATVILFDYLLPKSVVSVVKEKDITGFGAVPHVFEKLIRLEWPTVLSLRFITNTGGRLRASVSTTLQGIFPTTEIYSMYGFTEAFRATYLIPALLKSYPNSIGTSVPYAKVLIVNEANEICKAGEVGELIQSGPLVSAGYWGDPTLTAKKFRFFSFNNKEELFALSGDLCQMDENGLIEFISRKDNQFKLNGFRSSPEEVEYFFNLSPYTLVAACVPCTTRTNKFGVHTYAVLADDNDEDKARQWCMKNIPLYMQPDNITFISAIPTTNNNKTNYHRLRAMCDNSCKVNTVP